MHIRNAGQARYPPIPDVDTIKASGHQMDYRSRLRASRQTRPNDCFAFTITPCDVQVEQYSQEVRLNLPKDIKDSRELQPLSIAWLRSSRHFHFPIFMKRDRAVYTNGQGTQGQVVRESLDLLIEKFIELERGKDQIDRFKSARRKADANSFNVGLFTDLTLFSQYLAILTVLLVREARVDHVAWLCDRDNMTSYCDGIVWNYALESFLGTADLLKVDLKGLMPDVGVAHQSDRKSAMWYDEYIRVPDWMAGSIASWNRTDNSFPAPKHVQVIEDVLSDSSNAILLSIDIGDGGQNVTRIVITKTLPSEDPCGRIC